MKIKHHLFFKFKISLSLLFLFYFLALMSFKKLKIVKKSAGGRAH